MHVFWLKERRSVNISCSLGLHLSLKKKPIYFPAVIKWSSALALTVYLPPLFMIVGNASTLRLLRPKLLQVKERIWSSFCYFITISLPISFFLYKDSWLHFTGTRFVFSEREFADETLSKSAASAFCITAGHICPNYSSTWMAPGSQCSSEFVILTLSSLDKIIVDWRMSPVSGVSHASR